MTSKFLIFEEDNEGWRKDSTVEMSMRMPMNPTPAPPRTPRERVTTPPLSRSEEINTAYGVRNPEMAARLRRRAIGTPRYRRIRPDVVTGAQRVRASRSPRRSTSMTRGTSGGGSGGGY